MLSLDIAERDVAERREQWQPPQPKFERGYGVLFSEHITQANEGCDFGFLARRGRNPEPDPEVRSSPGAPMIQGFDPRTGEPVGEPVRRDDRRRLDAIVAAAVAAAPGLGRRVRAGRAGRGAGGRGRRARRPRRASSRRSPTPRPRWAASGSPARWPATTGQLRLFAGGAAGRRLPRPGGHPGRGRLPDLRPDQPAGRAGGRVRRVQLPVRVLGGGRRHRVGAGRGLPGRGQGARGPSGHLRRDRRDRHRRAGRPPGLPAGTFGLVHGVQAGLRLLRHPAIAAAGFTGSTAGGLALARICRRTPGADPVLR